MVSPTKSYLGDGAYVDTDGYQLILTAEDGIRVTNRVCLEPRVWDALLEYVCKVSPEWLKHIREEVSKFKENKMCDCNRGIPVGECGYCVDCCLSRGQKETGKTCQERMNQKKDGE